MNPKVDLFLEEGCGRCPHYQTTQCKVHAWQEALVKLRHILLDCGLTEDYKWSHPCYTIDGKNVVILGPFKEFCSLNFFKGALLEDEHQLLHRAGENTHAARQLRFTSPEEIVNKEDLIRTYIFDAIEVEKSGKKLEVKKKEAPLPEELIEKMNSSPSFKSAFEALTPGRQRGYILHFSQPKQSKTRTSRIEKCEDKILRGVGLHDEYKC